MSNKIRSLLWVSTIVGFMGISGSVWACYCQCYWGSDCPGNQYCDYSASCLHRPKGSPGACPRHGESGQCDGNCAGQSRPWDIAVVAIWRAVDLYFQAYEATVSTGQSGDPDPDLIRQAQQIQLPPGWHDDILRYIHSALDVTLGYDFGQPQTMDAACQTQFGFIRFVKDPDATRAILNATHQGFLDAIIQNDISAVLPPLQRFWTQYPDYQPAHVGRCYPHGHQYPENALQCQSDELMRMMTVWFSTRQPGTPGGAAPQPPAKENRKN